MRLFIHPLECGRLLRLPDDPGPKTRASITGHFSIGRFMVAPVLLYGSWICRTGPNTGTTRRPSRAGPWRAPGAVVVEPQESLGHGAATGRVDARKRHRLTAEPLVLCRQAVNPALKVLPVGTPDRFHAGIMHSSGTGSRRPPDAGDSTLEPIPGAVAWASVLSYLGGVAQKKAGSFGGKTEQARASIMWLLRPPADTSCTGPRSN
jgi:hypothetical protein